MLISDMTNEELKKELDIREQDVAVAIVRYNTVLKILQEKCKHELISEYEHEPNGDFDFLKAIRVCEICGLEEALESSQSGHSWKTLITDRFKRVNRDEIYKLRKYSI